MREIKRILSTLSKKRPLFHSEADFQHALAWEIHKELPNASVRLELPVQIKKQNLHIDIWIEHQSEALVLELKYKTCSLSIEIDNEQFRLKNQWAQDIGRYDFIKDIIRLEQVIAEKSNCTGYALLLTNDSSYWTEAANPNTVDAEFRINEGRTLEGQLQWGAGASEGTMKYREQPLTLRNTYRVEWQNYSQPDTTTFGTFRVLIIKVSKS